MFRRAHAVAGIAAIVVAGVVVVAIQLSDHGGTSQAASTPPAATALVTPSGATPSPARAAPPSPSSTTSSRPAAPATTATSRRKGVSAWAFDGSEKALELSGASWYYTWSTNHSGITTPKGVQFVPMIWGPGSATNGAIAAAKAAGTEVLGFNEPDMASQSNMSVSQALDLWPKLESTGRPLGSPAVATGADTAGGWLDQFMTGAKERGYRVDFVTLHWYGANFDTADAVRQLKSYVQAVWNRYHKPIWLTEYALIKFGSTATYPTGAQQAAFVTASTAMLDSLPYLARYAWFALPATSGTGTGLFRPGAIATPAGKAFEQAR